MADEQWTFPRWGCLAIAVACLGLMVWLPMQALSGMSSAVEVARVTSPDGALDAVLIETNGGAATSFGYRIHLVPEGQEPAGREAAYLYGATRSACAYGVNLRWAALDRLVIEHHQAERAEAANAEVAGRAIAVELKAGVVDPKAACGGMEYNLRGRPHG